MFNWIAGFIILLIIAAFIWPQSNNTSKQTINPFDKPAQSVKKKPAVDVGRSNSFSKESDNFRAQEFRDADIFDKKIRVLLDEAQTLVDKQFYTLPKSRNAISVYREILELSPNNSAARQGIDTVLENLLVIGQRSLSNNKLESANLTLKKLINIDQESEQTIKLTTRIALWHENKKRLDLVAQGDQAFSEQNYIAPATKNALYYYEQTLVLDQSNKAAQKGIQNIINVYLQNAQNSITQGDYSDASTNVEILIEIDPLYPLIPSLQNTILQAKQRAQQQETIAPPN